MHFQYGEAETGYLSRRDERMAAVIAQVGHIEREVDADLFSAVVHHIVGQQISTKAQATIWKRMRDELGTVDAAAVLGAGVEKMQSFGMTFRKAEYITDFARKIESGEFDLDGIWEKPDDEAIRELRGLKGVGVWTAEMILLFCMQRPNVYIIAATLPSFVSRARDLSGPAPRRLPPPRDRGSPRCNRG